MVHVFIILRGGETFVLGVVANNAKAMGGVLLAHAETVPANCHLEGSRIEFFKRAMG